MGVVRGIRDSHGFLAGGSRMEGQDEWRVAEEPLPGTSNAQAAGSSVTQDGTRVVASTSSF